VDRQLGSIFILTGELSLMETTRLDLSDYSLRLSSQFRMTLSKAIRWSENTWSVSIQTVVVLGARKAFNAGISELG
jgi:hypothetical protein